MLNEERKKKRRKMTESVNEWKDESCTTINMSRKPNSGNLIGSNQIGAECPI